MDEAGYPGYPGNPDGLDEPDEQVPSTDISDSRYAYAFIWEVLSEFAAVTIA